jgi:hypothetical protein
MDRVHGPGSRVHDMGTHLGSSNPRSTIRILCTKRVSTHLILVVRARSDGRAVGSDRGWRAMAEHHGLPEFKFSWAMVVGFWWGFLVRDHIDEGNLIRLTLIGGGRQRSLATVRRLSWCLVMERSSSGEASATRMCAEASSSSPLASRPINCSERRRKNSNSVAT